jgi:hypothetical protein
MFDLASLAELRLIQRKHRFRLTETGRRLAETLEPLIDTLDNESAANRCFVLVLLGDFGAAELLATTGHLPVSGLAALALEDLENRCAALRADLRRDDTQARYALAALAALGKACTFDDLRTALQQEPVSPLNRQALDGLNQWQDSEVTECLIETLVKLTPKSSPVHLASDEDRSRAGLIVAISRALFQTLPPAEMSASLRADLRHALDGTHYGSDDDAAFLLYLLDEHAGRERLVACLSHSIPITRQGAAAFLALIGDEWCIRQLARQAHGPADDGGHEATCALSLLEDDEAKRLAQHWLARHDGYEDADGKLVEIGGKEIRTWSWDEVLRSSLRTWVSYQYKETREKFGPLLKLWQGRRGGAAGDVA